MSGSPPGPTALGRGVIVAAGQRPPAPWTDAERIEIGPEAAAGAETLERLHRGWSERTPVVVSVAVDPAELREPEHLSAPPWSFDPGLDLPRERLHHLIWANNYDARGGEPTWWWGTKAERAGARIAGSAEVVLGDGTEAWVDGGPRWSVPALEPAVVHSEEVETGRLEPIATAAPAPGRLADDQLEAVTHPGGPVRVIAPAGSGKTRVLTERVRHLLAGRGYDRKGVLAVAYNKAAQLELEERLADVAPRTRTLNSLGYAVLSRRLGRRPPVLAEPEVRDLIEAAFPIPRQRRTNTDPVGPYLDALTQVRLGLRDPAIVEAERDDVPGLADGFEGFRAALRDRGAVDFDEQIYAALEALLGDGRFRREMAVEHRHLLVDEFQDLTPAHVLLIRLLAMPSFDVFGVGDDDQTIYDHAGADPRFLVDYDRYFPGAGSAALEVNYRCAEAIVTGAAKLLAYNRVRVGKGIRAAADADPAAEALEIAPHSRGEEVSSVAAAVERWRGEGTPAGEIAVLARVNSLLLGPQIALWSAGVPVVSSVGVELIERTGTAAALAWLRVAVDPDNVVGTDLDLIRRRPSRGFPRWISKWLVNCRSLGDLRGIERKIDDERVSRKLGELADDAEMLSALAASGASARELLEAVRDRVGLGEAMEMLDGSKGTEAAASHLDDLEALVQVADLEPDPGEFEPWLRASLEASRGDRGVTLSSIHRVKGREWDRVAVFGVTDGLLPHRLSGDWEAERRVLHVAVTRARERTIVLGDASRRSPFLAELIGEAAAPAARPAPAAAPAARPSAPVEIPDTAAAAALRGWRSERSRADGVPAYIVLTNRSLASIAEAMPDSEAALLDCEGIGPAKLERYGEEILEVVSAAG